MFGKYTERKMQEYYTNCEICYWELIDMGYSDKEANNWIVANIGPVCFPFTGVCIQWTSEFIERGDI